MVLCSWPPPVRINQFVTLLRPSTSAPWVNFVVFITFFLDKTTNIKPINSLWMALTSHLQSSVTNIVFMMFYIGTLVFGTGRSTLTHLNYTYASFVSCLTMFLCSLLWIAIKMLFSAGNLNRTRILCEVFWKETTSTRFSFNYLVFLVLRVFWNKLPFDHLACVSQ